MDRKAVSPVIAIVLLLMMTVAAAGAAYFWLTSIQSGMQKRSTKSIENIMQKSGRRLMAQAAICEPTAPEGMVAWWEFYEGGGNKTHDSSKNENTGTLYPGPEGRIINDSEMWVDGKAGEALEFDGNDSYVEVPDDDSLDFTGTTSFTISFWWKPMKFISWRRVIAKTEENAAGNNEGWGILGDSANEYLWYRRYENGTSDSCKLDYIIGEWHMYTLTYDGSKMLSYLDGEQDDTTGSTLDIADTTNPLYIANFKGGYVLEHSYLDDVRIYDRALSADEINETYKGKMKVKVTVRNVGSVEIPEAKFVANLKKDGTTVDSDTYVTESSIDTGDLKTLTFYFNEMRPGGEKYMVSIPGIGVSQTVNCQSLKS